MVDEYSSDPMSRDDVDKLEGPVVIEFGNAWCGHCRAVQPLLASAFAGHAGVRHIKIADGSGLPLGRSFQVRLWPTLVFMKGGIELSRLVRPRSSDAIREALMKVDPPRAG